MVQGAPFVSVPDHGERQARRETFPTDVEMAEQI